MTGRVSRNLIEAFSWRVASEMSVRFPDRIEIIETHPGGGTYDCLTLVLTPATGRCERIDLNRNGSAHVHSKDDFVSVSDFWERCVASDDLRDPIAELCELAGLKAGVEEVLPTTEESLCFSIMANVTSALALDARPWRWESVVLDTSHGVELRGDILEAFPRVRTLPLTQQDVDHRVHEAYRYWGLMVNGGPAALVDVRGLVHFTDETFMEIGRADPNVPLLALRQASEMLRVLSL